MTSKPTSPSTRREAMNALLLGELDALCDKVEGLNTTITHSINQLEGAGDRYNQAVLAAHRRSKDEMMAYGETASKIFLTSTRETQAELVREIVRNAVSDEIIALKKALKAANRDERSSTIDRWGVALLKMCLTGIISAFATLEIFWLFYH